MTRLLAVLSLVLVACPRPAPAPVRRPPAAQPIDPLVLQEAIARCCELNGDPDAGAQREACVARGCRWKQQPWCVGMRVAPDELNAVHAAQAACQFPCVCFCEEDEELCGRRP